MENWLQESDAFILAYDITNKISLEAIERLMAKINEIEEDEAEKKPVVIVGNSIMLFHLVSSLNIFFQIWSSPNFLF